MIILCQYSGLASVSFTIKVKPFQILEKSLRLLFETKDVSQVKDFVQRQFVKILQGKVSIQDYIFAKEYRGIKGYKPGATVPALELARCVCVCVRHLGCNEFKHRECFIDNLRV